MHLAQLLRQTHLALRTKEFTDQELRLLPDESFARLAFTENEPLQRDFPSETTFLAYWRSLQSKGKREHLVR